MNSHLKDQIIIEADRREELNTLISDSMSEHDTQILKKLGSIIENNPHLIPKILQMCSDNLIAYKKDCEKRNNFLLREALGDAVHLLGMERKPARKDFVQYCIRIKKAIFSEGITSHHHQGERNFYNRFLKEDI